MAKRPTFTSMCDKETKVASVLYDSAHILAASGHLALL
eukprot:SAG31_NODE_36873_length_309_cov_0.990476_1_plen_37_part_01